MFLFVVFVEAGWPFMDELASAATTMFHNKVIGSLMTKQNHTLLHKNKVEIINSTPAASSFHQHNNFGPLATTSKVSTSIVPDPSEFVLPQDKKRKKTEGKLRDIAPIGWPTRAQLYQLVPQSTDLTYKSEATACNIFFVMLRNDWFDDEAWSGAAQVLKILYDLHPDYAYMIRNVPKLRHVDFSSLRIPRHDYATQLTIEPRRVWLMAACAVHYQLDVGLVVRYLNGEYLAKWRDIEAIVGAVRGLVSATDLKHIIRILKFGCPAKFNWEESAANKEAFILRGNNPTAKANKEMVQKTLNKEERNNHIIPLPAPFC